MTKQGGLFKLDKICAKLKGGKAEDDHEAIADYSNVSTGKETHIGVNDKHTVAQHGSENDMNSNGIKTGLHELIPHQRPEITESSIPSVDMAELDLSRRQHDLASSSSSNVSSIAPQETVSKPETSAVSVNINKKKSRRKNTTPKNLYQIKDKDDGKNGHLGDELREYQCNNPDVDFHLASLTDGLRHEHFAEGVLDLSSNKRVKELSNQIQSHAENNPNYAMDDFGVLDLSKRNSVKSMNKAHEKSLQESNGELNPPFKATGATKRKNKARHFPFTLNELSPVSLPRPNQPMDASHMKDFAESTVNELLSMYGLGEGEQSVTQSVPIENFASGNILKWHQPRETMAVSPAFLTEKETPTKSSISNELRDETNSPSQFGLAESPKQDPDEGESSITGYQTTKIGALFSPLKDSSYPDYGKYVTRYRDFEHCGQNDCKDAQLREHFHCRECPSKIFLKKDEMIRHFKWHRKRDESLQHGFMRYSPLDDCSKRFIDCAHNNKQTHYHCIQPGCNKVYISTSDVQMHANYHRKDSAIQQQGFQRFRATEDCETQSCPFYGQRTTHFHCRRPDCSFTFKNKADIEKHKNYHQKDDILSKDGFKKFMKYDNCNYAGCRFSNISNHIHCVRPGCDYVLHSTSQLLSHKRKHERREIEFAYRKYKDTSTPKTTSLPQAMLNPALLAFANSASMSQASLPFQVKSEESSPNATGLVDYLKRTRIESSASSVHRDDDSISEAKSSTFSEDQILMPDEDADEDEEEVLRSDEEDDEEDGEDELGSSGDMLSKTHPGAFSSASKIKMDPGLSKSINLPVLQKPDPNAAEMSRSDSPLTGQSPSGFVPKISPPVNEKRERDETWKQYLTRYTANDPCHSRCQFLYKDHYHCNDPNCGILFRSKDGVRDHARQHENLDRITELSYMAYAKDAPCVEGCPFYKIEKHFHCLWTGCSGVIPESGPVFQRLDHYHIHEFAQSNGRKPIFGFMKSEQNLKRKRGRPPKFPKQDIPIVPKIEMEEQDIQAQTEMFGSSNPIAFGYTKYEQNQPCRDDKCMYFMKQHYHCVRKRCHHATDNEDVLNLHARDFHSYITILEGFEFFDRNVNCRRPHCHNNKVNRHYHCVRPKCDYSFVRYSTMSQHNKKHIMAEMGLTISPGIAIPNTNVQNGDMHTNANQIPSHSAPLAVSSGLQNESIPLPISAAILPKGAPSQSTTADLQGTLSTAQLINFATSQSSAISSMAQANGLSMDENASVAPIVIQPIEQPPSSINLKQAHIPIPLLPKTVENNQPHTTLPLASLLQQKSNITPQMNWTTMLVKMHYGINANCGRPFCKLKKKDHYHCFDCNQAFCDPIRLKTHAVKHGLILDKANNVSGRFLPRMSAAIANTSAAAVASINIPVTQLHPVPNQHKAQHSDNESDIDDDQASSSLNLNPMEFTNMLQKSQHVNTPLGEYSATSHSPSNQSQDIQNDDLEAESDEEGQLQIDENATDEDMPDFTHEENMPENESAVRITRKRSLSSHPEDTSISKTPKISGTSAQRVATRAGKQTSGTEIPDGFNKFCSGNDCRIEKCTYRYTLTHYHCVREDCVFGTADRSRLMQHVERHRRTDEILGNDFKQYRLSQDCNACEHSGKGTHYHCLKCKFVCLELSKVQAHRKNHQKQEAISAQGFLKVGAAETCTFTNKPVACNFSGRVTHYHCTQNGGNCGFIAHGLQVISSHNKSAHGQ